MIAYAPFEDLTMPKITYEKVLVQPKQCTECNYVVLAFIASIFLMALFDALK